MNTEATLYRIKNSMFNVNFRAEGPDEESVAAVRDRFLNQYGPAYFARAGQITTRDDGVVTCNMSHAHKC